KEESARNDSHQTKRMKIDKCHNTTILPDEQMKENLTKSGNIEKTLNQGSAEVQPETNIEIDEQ
ncbi:16806_t:CDS:2, partial [Gigaspora rosea]